MFHSSVPAEDPGGRRGSVGAGTVQQDEHEHQRCFLYPREEPAILPGRYRCSRGLDASTHLLSTSPCFILVYRSGLTPPPPRMGCMCLPKDTKDGQSS